MVEGGVGDFLPSVFVEVDEEVFGWFGEVVGVESFVVSIIFVLWRVYVCLCEGCALAGSVSDGGCLGE